MDPAFLRCRLPYKIEIGGPGASIITGPSLKRSARGKG